jgi:hypothetical protein
VVINCAVGAKDWIIADERRSIKENRRTIKGLTCYSSTILRIKIGINLRNVVNHRPRFTKMDSPHRTGKKEQGRISGLRRLRNASAKIKFR